MKATRTGVKAEGTVSSRGNSWLLIAVSLLTLSLHATFIEPKSFVIATGRASGRPDQNDNRWLMIRSEVGCKVTVDVEQMGDLKRPNVMQVVVGPGEHIVSAHVAPNGSRFEKVVPARARETLVEIEFGRLVNNGDSTVTDTANKLMWTQSDVGKDMDWMDADSHCADLSLAGHGDWRLPTVEELEQLFDRGKHTSQKIMRPFLLSGYTCWSSSKNGSNRAFSFDFWSGRSSTSSVQYSRYQRALCVRQLEIEGGHSVAIKRQTSKPTAPLLVKTTFACQWILDGKDMGTLEAEAIRRVDVRAGRHEVSASLGKGGSVFQGVATVREREQAVVLIDFGRFVDQGDGTVTDTYTGVTWTKDDNGRDVNWNQAAAYCEQLSLSKHSDWELPRIFDLEELYNALSKGSATAKSPLGLTGNFHWSSTAHGPNGAWLFNFKTGERVTTTRQPSALKRALCVRHHRAVF